MPLLKGKSKSTRRKNFHELRYGKTFARTARKFGRLRALKQMIAIEMSNERKTAKRHAAKKR